MACFHPLPAWRTKNGDVTLSKEKADTELLRLPCGGCLGCRLDRARQWAIRCKLEAHDHTTSAFLTLTYDDRWLPPTLQKQHLSRFIKRLREHLRRSAARHVRHFSAGEYGEINGRPHYHALVFGLSTADRRAVDQAWSLGFTHIADLTDAAINYVAGYNSKKIGWRRTDHREERVHPDTGEIYTYQPPFILMSRRPGIGHSARRWPHSWRDHAIHKGKPVPAPRYLHSAWEQHATPEDIEALEYEKHIHKINNANNSTAERLKAKEKITEQRHHAQAERRTL